MSTRRQSRSLGLSYTSAMRLGPHKAAFFGVALDSIRDRRWRVLVRRAPDTPPSATNVTTGAPKRRGGRCRLTNRHRVKRPSPKPRGRCRFLGRTLPAIRRLAASPPPPRRSQKAPDNVLRGVAPLRRTRQLE